MCQTENWAVLKGLGEGGGTGGLGGQRCCGKSSPEYIDCLCTAALKGFYCTKSMTTVHQS